MDNIFSQSIDNLKTLETQYDASIVELSCKLYQEGKSKIENYEYLKKILPNKTKTQAILHIVECLKDDEHPIMPSYMSYVVAIRYARNKNKNNELFIE